MKRLLLRFLTTVLVCVAGVRSETTLGVHHLRCEYKVDPLGIDVSNPRLSWELTSTEKGVLETSYEVRVTTPELHSAKQQVVWETGKVASDASIQVAYAGAPLESGRIYHWQVRVADNHGHLSEWSETAKWEMGLLNPADWQAQWITPNLAEDENNSNPSPMLRREFDVKKKIERARLYASAMGLYELHLNGERVGDQYFTPGWTSYDFRYQYQTYDVTKLLRKGSNCIGAILGDGWYRGVLLWNQARATGAVGDQLRGWNTGLCAERLAVEGFHWPHPYF